MRRINVTVIRAWGALEELYPMYHWYCIPQTQRGWGLYTLYMSPTCHVYVEQSTGGTEDRLWHWVECGVVYGEPQIQKGVRPT